MRFIRKAHHRISLLKLHFLLPHRISELIHGRSPVMKPEDPHSHQCDAVDLSTSEKRSYSWQVPKFGAREQGQWGSKAQKQEYKAVLALLGALQVPCKFVSK